jgi:hypothetical protein
MRFNQVLANCIKPQFQLDPALLIQRVTHNSHLTSLDDVLCSGCIRQRPQSLGDQVPPLPHLGQGGDFFYVLTYAH